VRPYLEWFDKEGFYTDNAWDIPTKQWIGRGRLQLFQHQRRILGHCLTPDAQGKLPYTTVVFSAPKKSGKSKISASVGAWAGEEVDDSEVYVVANDFEQAQGIVYSDISKHLNWGRGIMAGMRDVRLENGTLIKALAQSYATAAGTRHFLSVWDELWGYKHESSQRMWAELTPPPTVPNAFRFISTYAGFMGDSELLWDLYEGAWLEGEPVEGLEDIVNTQGDPVCRKKGTIFVAWDDVPRMPWQTEEYYEEQMQTLRPADFLRIHRNQWVDSSDGFIPVKYWDDACTLDGQLIYKEADERMKYPVYVGVDIGPKHDCSAAVAVYYNTETNRPGLAAHRIWTPDPDENFDIRATVEAEIFNWWKFFQIAQIGYDPYQFHASAVTLQNKGLPMIEFTQTTSNMIAATQSLYSLLRAGTFDVYKDDEFRDHVRFAPVQASSRGYRLLKNKHAKFPIDAAVALAMATHLSVQPGAVAKSEPLRISSPFSDVSVHKIPSYRAKEEAKLPWQLRS
jgi:phage terminase large subunit-like protein